MQEITTETVMPHYNNNWILLQWVRGLARKKKRETGAVFSTTRIADGVALSYTSTQAS